MLVCPFARKRRRPGRNSLTSTPPPITVGLNELLPPTLLRTIRGKQHYDQIRLEFPGFANPWRDVGIGRIAPDALTLPRLCKTIVLNAEESETFSVVLRRGDVNREVPASVEAGEIL